MTVIREYRETDKNTELEIEYTGKLPCEDYSY